MKKKIKKNNESKTMTHYYAYGFTVQYDGRTGKWKRVSTATPYTKKGKAK